MPYADKARGREYSRLWQSKRTLSKPTHNMFYLAKQRAKERGLEFTIELEDLNIPELCPVLGIPLKFKEGRNNAPSLDRVDPEKGYTKDNIQIISTKANQLKSNATLPQLKQLVNYVEEHYARCH